MSVSLEHPTEASHPPHAEHPSRLTWQQTGSVYERVPVALDDFAFIVAKGGTDGLDECISKAIEAISDEVHLRQQQTQQHNRPQDQTKRSTVSLLQCSPPAFKQNPFNPSNMQSPRRSPVRMQLAQLSQSALNDAVLPPDDSPSVCIFCQAAVSDHESKQRRSLVTITNPVTGNELSPGGALPMRAPVAVCGRCNGGVCETHLMLHSVKMPSHWDGMVFHDRVVDAAYRSLPPHAQLLSRVMLSLDTIRKRAAEQRAQGTGYSNPYHKSRDVYRRDVEWDGSEFRSFEISSVLARCASMEPTGYKAQGDDSLSFESRFESGNLARAERIGPSDYVLYMREDINFDPLVGRDKCYNQWFYFRVDGMQQQRTYTFHLCNMYKAKSLFQAGMHVLLRAPDCREWFRGGSDYIYKESTFFKKANRVMYQLTFRLCTPHASLYVAAAQPYTYTNLCEALDCWQGQMARAQFMKRRTLCRTLAGNVVDFLTITHPETNVDQIGAVGPTQQISSLPEEQRPWIVVCGRVHPSESNSSWFVHGLIDFLTDPYNVVSEQLRRKFVWLVVPMINPDGVICGNSRCNLAGLDLNRCWANPSEITSPTIFHAKALMQRLCSLATITLFLDVHGHSRKRGAFFYGNRRQVRSISGQPVPLSSAPAGPEVKIPQLLASCSPVFSLSDCNYNICRSKMGTARYVMFNEFQLVNSFTLEISMFAAVSSSDSHLSSLGSQEFEASDTAVRHRTFRDAIHGASGTVGGSVNISASHLIPQHMEKNDFMKLSRDFATCLSTSDLSWMVDQDGCIMKMALSPSSTFIYEIPDYQDTEILTPERKHAIEWLWSHDMSFLGDKESPTDSRLLGECKSINGAAEIQARDALLPTLPISARMMKILLCSVRAHHELQGEASHTRTSVQSFILNQLRAHVKKTDIAQLHDTLRALGDWMEFVMNNNKKQRLQREGKEIAELDLDPSAPISSGISVCSDFSMLDIVRRRINDALQRLYLPQTDSTVSFVKCGTKDIQAHETQAKQEFESLVANSTEPVDKSTATASPCDQIRRIVQITPPENEPPLPDSSSLSPSHSSMVPRVLSQSLNSCIKPWSLSFSVPDAQSPVRPSPTANQALDACSIRSSPTSVGSRIRQRILLRKNGLGVAVGGRVDVVDAAKKEITNAAATSANALTFVTLAAPPITTSLVTHPPLVSPSFSTMRRVRVAGAIPFPVHQTHHSTTVLKQSSAASEQHQSCRMVTSSNFGTKMHTPFDIFAANATRPLEFSIVSEGNSDRLWSLPSVGGGIGEADVRKSNGGLTVGEVLVLKQPPVTTVQPFNNAKPPSQRLNKQSMRPSTYR